MLLSVNLSDVSAEGPPQLEPGVYTLEATKVVVNPAAQGKPSSIEVTFKDANGEGEDERSVRKLFTISEKALPFLKRWLLACKRKDLAETAELDTDMLMGLTCEAVVNSRTWSDKDTGEARSGPNIQRFIEPAKE